MIHLSDIVDLNLLEAMIAGRYVSARSHPSLPLEVLNYTARAQYDNIWNDATMLCRGLIVRTDSREVVARPFRKFFALSSEHAELDGPVHITEKMDGSLGILYPTGTGLAIATRGSFTSDQALHATNIWNDRYAHIAHCTSTWTYLVEIIYAANRIVVDYGDVDDIVLLGAVDIASGASVPLQQAREGWPGPVVVEHAYSTTAQYLAAPSRDNSEGVVIHFLDHDVRVKHKTPEYLRRHRLVTDISERRVWEVLSTGGDIVEWCSTLPDEIYRFVQDTATSLQEAYDSARAGLDEADRDIRAALPESFTRAQYAEHVARLAPTYSLARGLFSLLDGVEPSDLIWKSVRPSEHVPFHTHRSVNTASC